MLNQEPRKSLKTSKKRNFKQIIKRHIELIMKKYHQKNYQKGEICLKIKLLENLFLDLETISLHRKKLIVLATFKKPLKIK